MSMRYKLVPKVKIYRLDNQKYLDKLDLSSYEIKELLIQRKRHVIAVFIAKEMIKIDVRSYEMYIAKNVPLTVSILARIAEDIKEAQSEIVTNTNDNTRVLHIIKSIVEKYLDDLAKIMIREVRIVYLKDEFCEIITISFEY